MPIVAFRLRFGIIIIFFYGVAGVPANFAFLLLVFVLGDIIIAIFINPWGLSFRLSLSLASASLS